VGLFVAALGATYLVVAANPLTFPSGRRPGLFLSSSSYRTGGSLQRTDEVAKQVRDVLKDLPAPSRHVRARSAVSNFLTQRGAQSTRRWSSRSEAVWDQRPAEQGARTSLQRCRPKLLGASWRIHSAELHPVDFPGLGTTGVSIPGRRTPPGAARSRSEVAQAVSSPKRRKQRRAKARQLFSQFRTSDRQVQLRPRSPTRQAPGSIA